MADNYEVMARVMREFSHLPRGKSINRAELPTMLSLPQNDTDSAVSAIQRRSWAVVDPRTVRLIGNGVEYAGKNAAQILALDVVDWIRKLGHRQFPVSEMPADLRAEPELLELALKDLQRAEAVQVLYERGRPDEIRVLAGWKTYEFGDGAPTTSVQVQHVGPSAGRDIIVNTGSGVVQTGDHNTVTINADAAESLRVFVDGLRGQGELNAHALDLLHEAARPEASPSAVKGIVREAVEQEPRLADRLKKWVGTIPGHVAMAAVVEGVKLALRSAGVPL